MKSNAVKIPDDYLLTKWLELEYRIKLKLDLMDANNALAARVKLEVNTREAKGES